jgi:hypothetical protein
LFLTDLDFPAHLSLIAIGPGHLDQITPGMTVAAFGDGAETEYFTRSLEKKITSGF